MGGRGGKLAPNEINKRKASARLSRGKLRTSGRGKFFERNDAVFIRFKSLISTVPYDIKKYPCVKFC